MKKILIVNENYHEEITKSLVNASLKILKKNNYKVSMLTVPGVFEIPISIKKNINKFDGFIAIGCVIKGKTPHFELICKSSFDAIINLSINHKKPITNGIITALTKRQAYERCGKIKSKNPNKGKEAAMALMSVIKNGPKKI